MKRYLAFFLLCVFLLPASSCTQQKKEELPLPPAERPPAVAGQFYPADSTELERMVDGLFLQAKIQPIRQEVRALVSPHAGYVFSGEVAAAAYRQLDSAKPYKCVILIGPSHHVGFSGASVYAAGSFRTPLGRVPIDGDLARALLKSSPLFSNRTDAHEKEHSIEVQLPFLQHLYRNRLVILPILLGDNTEESCAQIAAVLKPYLRSDYLFVVSTDFSHYPAYEDALRIDRATAAAIQKNSLAEFVRVLQSNARQNIPGLGTSACGWTGVLTLLSMTAGEAGGSYHLVQYRNSGDTPYGDKGRVVGYCAMMYARSGEKRTSTFLLDEKDKRDLLRIARETIRRTVERREIPEVDPASLSPHVAVPCGAFVTLKEQGNLRGCIGSFEPADPLWQVVQRMAVASSTQDSRFEPVRSEEIPKIEIEISVLTPMRKIASVDEIRLGTHGIYIRKGSRGGTFLPQVATETGWTLEEFLGHCARDKAGIGWDGWREAEIYVYEAIVFDERAFR